MIGKIKTNYFFILFGIAMFFLGCGDYQNYVQQNVLPQHIKKIAVVKFKDNFNQPAFQDKLYFTLKDRFTIDRRIDVVNIELADAVLIGNISRYILQPLQYDSNKNVTKYLLWVWIDISLYDATTKNILWTEEKLESKIEFNTNSKNSSFEVTTESEAQDISINNLTDSIVKRTIDGWFYSSGVKETVYA